MTYDPQPQATHGVELPPQVQGLIERLAEHLHDVWSARRLAEGWTLGPERDDAAKRHPCLVPYAELPEIEKEYDRKSAEETLKLILVLGGRIEVDP